MVDVARPVALERLERAELLLAQASDPSDFAAIRDMAEAARVYAQQVNLGTRAINHATRIKLLAERGLADSVDEGQAAGEIATQEQGRPVSVRSANTSSPVTLASLGLVARQVSEARLIRDQFTEAEIEAVVAEADAAGKEVARSTLVKAARSRKRREAQQTTEPVDLSAVGTFDLLYVDPPWRYEHGEPTRVIENHYPTMSLPELKALEPPATSDSVLAMWATSPKLAEALELMAAWGFEYRTCAVWVKHAIGMGYYFRQRHELLLIGKRGRGLSMPEPTDRPDSVIEAERGKHSEKPALVYEHLERMFPIATKVELFARTRRDGWAAWGNQA